jgi:hypothetical protein
MQRCILGLAVLALLSGTVAVTHAETFTGSLSYSPSDVDPTDGLFVAGDTWKQYEITIEWEVTDEDPTAPDGFPWKYKYRLTLVNPEPEGKLQAAPSHMIIEASDGFDEEDLDELTGDVTLDSAEFQQNNPGNPGIPEGVWGIKVDPIAEDDFDVEWMFFSNRVPVWGDFYTKGSSDDYAYNYNKSEENEEKGFTAPNDTDPNDPPSTDPDGLYHILRPDSVIPEPSTLVLLGMGAVGLSVYRLRRRRR